MYIITYGTLRKGEERAYVFEKYAKIKSRKIITLKGYRMYDLLNYPAAFKTDDENDKIVAELLELSFENKQSEKELIKMLDFIEGVAYNYYIKKYIEIDGKNTLIYVMNPDFFSVIDNKYRVIVDWKKEVRK